MLALGWHLWHARNGASYNTWSGWLADIALLTIFTGVVASLAAWWRKHNCHVHGCWRLSWHPHPAHGHPVCARHHPHGQGRGDHLHPRHHSPDAHLKWNTPTDVPPWSGNAPAMTWSGIIPVGGTAECAAPVAPSPRLAVVTPIRKDAHE